MTAVHHGGEESGAVNANYERMLRVIDLARQSGLPAARQSRAFPGADQPLIPPYSDNWRDTEPIVTEASEAILAAARGASPDSPVWVVPLGPLNNVAWRIDVPGLGWSSPIVWGDRVFLTTAVDAQGTEQPKEGFYLGKDRCGRGEHGWLVLACAGTSCSSSTSAGTPMSCRRDRHSGSWPRTRSNGCVWPHPRWRAIDC